MKTFRFTILFACIFSVFATTVHAQRGHLNWAGAWQFGTSGSVYMDPQRDLVFLGSGGAVQILDVSDPADPALVNETIRTAGLVEDIWYRPDDQNLYLACGRGGFEVWNVSDANAPVRLSRMPILYFDEETPVRHVEVYNNIAVLECSWGYLHTVDISDPQNPVQLHFNGEMGNPAHDFHIDRMGMIHATGAQYYVRYFLGEDGSLSNTGTYETLYGSYAVFGQENEAYVQYNGNLYLLDLTLPGFPAWSITPLQFSDIQVIEGMAYIVNQDGFEIWDVSNVQSPVQVGSVAAPQSNELYVSGNMAYLSGNYNGLYAVDISDPSAPQITGQYPGYGWSAASIVSGNYAYLCNSFVGLLVIDISDPYGSGPHLTGTFASNGETRDVEVRGQTAYIADYSGGFRIADISDPAAPEGVSDVDIQAWRVALGEGNIVFVDEANPNLPDTLWVYDVSDPANPQTLGSFIFPETVREMKYHNGFLYAAVYDSGLMILDMSDPANPSEAATADLPKVLDVWVQDQVAYVASLDWDGGFATVDISDPENPQIMQIYNPQGWFQPFHVAVSGNYAYVGLNFGEIHLFDVSDPTNVIDLDTYVTPGESVHLNAGQQFMYIADGPIGLQIISNDLITGIAEPEPSARVFNLETFPNPVRENINFVFEINQSEQVAVNFYNIAGRLLYQTPEMHFSSGDHRLNLPVSVISAEGHKMVLYDFSAGGQHRHGKLVLIPE